MLKKFIRSVIFWKRELVFSICKLTNCFVCEAKRQIHKQICRNHIFHVNSLLTNLLRSN